MFSTNKLFLTVVLVSFPLFFINAQTVPIRFSIGGGSSILFWGMNQDLTCSGTDYDMLLNGRSVGVNAFFDLTQYFTVDLGYRFSLGSFSQSISGQTANFSNTTSQYDLGGEFKYPLYYSKSYSVAPSLGIDFIGYSTGETNNEALSSDGKKVMSPICLTLGADFNHYISKDVFIRIPLRFGIGLNAKLSDSYYYNIASYLKLPSYSYTSSSNIMFETGIEIGYSTPDKPNDGNDNQAPAIPTGLTARVEGNTVYVEWNSVNGATSYKLYDTKDGTIPTVAHKFKVYKTTKPTKVLSDVTIGDTYTFAVSALTPEGESVLSDPILLVP
jgi:hypothetical protein